jgi:flagellar FliJ protein
MRQKRSERMEKLLEINRLNEGRAAVFFATARERYRQLKEQLDKLEQYWIEYDQRLETVKQSTRNAADLRDHQQFMARLNEAIGQQRAELERSAIDLESAESDLRQCRIEVEKIKSAAASIREQEQALERKRAQKETDELYANGS